LPSRTSRRRSKRAKTRRGANAVAFTGRTATRRLAPGAYRATVVATDPAGNRSKAVSVAFIVVRR
jgi:hypothetical protein